MSTLTDFGVDAPEPAANSHTAPNGRCEAIVGGNDTIRRCRNEPTTGSNLCTSHKKANSIITIHDDPYDIVTSSFQRRGQCRGIQADGNRCPNSTYPFTQTCSVHSPAVEYDTVVPDEIELNQELIADALEQVSESFSPAPE